MTTPDSPARKIPRSYRNVTGRVAMAGAERSVHFESPLERDFYILLDFNPEVESVQEQPFRIEYLDSDGALRTYYPDALVTFASETDRKPMLCEVKPREQLRTRWAELRPRFRAAVAFAAKRGWKFKIYSDLEIRGEYLDNVKLLREYRQYPVDEMLWGRIQKTLRDEPVHLAELVSACSSKAISSGMVMPQIWRQICAGRLVTDLERKIDHHTEVRLAEEL